jgi:hypothetical protein
MLPVLPRIPNVDDMINGNYYFIIHAPRQSGKTTFLKILTKKINSEKKIYALYCSLELLQGVNDIKTAMTTIVSQVIYASKKSGVDVLKKLGITMCKALIPHSIRKFSWYSMIYA